MQIEDLGYCKKGDVHYFETTDFSFKGKLPIQTGGGMINCGQPSTAGGMVHIVEAVTQLRGVEHKDSHSMVPMYEEASILDESLFRKH